MPGTVLLISDNKNDNHWCQLLREALAPLYLLDIQREEIALECISQNDYALIIVDALVVHDVAGLISSLRGRRPEVYIVVVSASPTWQRARDAFLAGATDYIRKSWDRRELRLWLSAILTEISLSIKPKEA